MTKIVLLRHGQTEWNEQNRFAGWTHVDLSKRGREEALKAAEALKSQGYSFDYAFVSVLKRAIRTPSPVPVVKEPDEAQGSEPAETPHLDSGHAAIKCRTQVWLRKR